MSTLFAFSTVFHSTTIIKIIIMRMALSSLSRLTVKPSVAWWFVFLPALMYYTSTRLHSLGLFRASSYGEIVETSLVVVSDCTELQESGIVYINKDCTSLYYPLYKVRDDFTNIVATTWKHVEELGRGYLLLSTSNRHGKIWQWETGGGPIPIGRTLSMVNSGCRSNLYQNCNSSDAGSGGIVVDALHKPPRLIVAEWGEGRITRLEANGARTPLILEVPYADSGNSSSNFAQQRRLQHPFKMLLSPFGDLLVLDSTTLDGDYLWQLQQAHKIPGLESLPVSREAHEWTQLNNTNALQSLLQSTRLGGMAFCPKKLLQLYVTMRQGDSVVVVTLSLDEDDDEDDEEIDDDDSVDVEEVESEPKSTMERQSAIFLDYSRYANEPGPMEVDEKGNLYLVVDHGILFVSSSGSVLGKLSIPDVSIVDITLGEDRFLYISTETKLFRARLRNKLWRVPTDLILKK